MPETGAIAQTDDDFDTEEKGGETATQTSGEKSFTQADIDRIVADRVAREKAKYADYNDLKRKAAAAMTDAERAVAEAEQRGADKVRGETARELAAARFEAIAAGQVNKEAVARFLEFADMSKFVGEDGKPNLTAIGKAVKGLSTSAPATNYDGGARTNSAKPNDMNALIRRSAGFGD